MSGIKDKLAADELVIGPFISEIRNPNVAFLLAQAGFDYFILDNEHGAFSPETISDMIAAARGAEISVIVRIPEVRREAISKTLDSGADGILVPQIETAAQAEEVVQLSLYPPVGVRGLGLRRAHSRYARVEAGTYMEQANKDLFIAVQAESKSAVENIEDIVAVQGIDCIFVGPFDLSVSLGIPGQINHERAVAAISRVISVCSTYKKTSGILMFDAELLKFWIAQGVRFAAYSSDVSMLADSARQSVQELRAL